MDFEKAVSLIGTVTDLLRVASAHGKLVAFPPDKQEAATSTGVQQAQLFSGSWANM